MSKTNATTGGTGELIHTRTTAGSEESQVAVIGIDGSDSVVPADATYGLGVDIKRVAAGQGRTLVTVAVDQSVAATLDVVAAQGAGLKIKVTSVLLVLTAAGTLQFKRGTTPTIITGVVPLDANGGFVAHGQPSSPLFETGANEKLTIVSTGGGARGYITYVVEA